MAALCSEGVSDLHSLLSKDVPGQVAVWSASECDSGVRSAKACLENDTGPESAETQLSGF